MRRPLRPPRWPFAPREAMDVCSVFTSRRGVQDLASRALWTSTGTAVTAADIGPTDALVAGSPTAWDLRDTSNTSYVTLDAKGHKGRTTYTVLACGISVGATGNDYRGVVAQMGGYRSGSGNFFRIKDNGGGLNAPIARLDLVDGGTARFVETTLSSRVWYGDSSSHPWILGAIVDGSTAPSVVAADLLTHELASAAFGTWTTGPATGTNPLLVASQYTGYANTADIALAWVCAWPRALSTTEIGEIVARPWSIVEEYAAKTYFLPLVLGGGGGGGFQPAWAARSTTTIVGGGVT